MSTFTASDGTVFADRREFRKYEFELSYTFRNRGAIFDERLILKKDAPEIDGQPFELENLKSCDVMLLDHTEAIQADELENCRVLIGACCDSVFVRNCTNCTFSVACKQLRTRDCVGCTFYLLCNTEPVIETSSDIAMAPLNLCYPGLLGHVAAAGLDPRLNLWFAVHDFNDPASSPVTGGKNWRVLSGAEEEKGTRKEDQTTTVPSGRGLGGSQPEQPWWLPCGPCDAAIHSVPRVERNSIPIPSIAEAEAAAGGGAGDGTHAFALGVLQADAEAMAAATISTAAAQRKGPDPPPFPEASEGDEEHTAAAAAAAAPSILATGEVVTASTAGAAEAATLPAEPKPRHPALTPSIVDRAKLAKLANRGGGGRGGGVTSSETATAEVAAAPITTVGDQGTAQAISQVVDAVAAAAAERVATEADERVGAEVFRSDQKDGNYSGGDKGEVAQEGGEVTSPIAKELSPEAGGVGSGGSDTSEDEESSHEGGGDCDADESMEEFEGAAVTDRDAAAVATMMITVVMVETAAVNDDDEVDISWEEKRWVAVQAKEETEEGDSLESDGDDERVPAGGGGGGDDEDSLDYGNGNADSRKEEGGGVGEEEAEDSLEENEDLGAEEENSGFFDRDDDANNCVGVTTTTVCENADDYNNDFDDYEEEEEEEEEDEEGGGGAGFADYERACAKRLEREQLRREQTKREKQQQEEERALKQKQQHSLTHAPRPMVVLDADLSSTVLRLAATLRLAQRFARERGKDKRASYRRHPPPQPSSSSAASGSSRISDSAQGRRFSLKVLRDVFRSQNRSDVNRFFGWLLADRRFTTHQHHDHGHGQGQGQGGNDGHSNAGSCMELAPTGLNTAELHASLRDYHSLGRPTAPHPLEPSSPLIEDCQGSNRIVEDVLDCAAVDECANTVNQKLHRLYGYKRYNCERLLRRFADRSIHKAHSTQAQQEGSGRGRNSSNQLDMASISLRSFQRGVMSELRLTPKKLPKWQLLGLWQLLVHQESGQSLDVRHDHETGAPHTRDGSVELLVASSVSLYDLSCVLEHKFHEPVRAQAEKETRMRLGRAAKEAADDLSTRLKSVADANRGEAGIWAPALDNYQREGRAGGVVLNEDGNMPDSFAEAFTPLTTEELVDRLLEEAGSSLPPRVVAQPDDQKGASKHKGSGGQLWPGDSPHADSDDDDDDGNPNAKPYVSPYAYKPERQRKEQACAFELLDRHDHGGVGDGGENSGYRGNGVEEDDEAMVAIFGPPTAAGGGGGSGGGGGNVSFPSPSIARAAAERAKASRAFFSRSQPPPPPAPHPARVLPPPPTAGSAAGGGGVGKGVKKKSTLVTLVHHEVNVAGIYGGFNQVLLLNAQRLEEIERKSLVKLAARSRGHAAF